MAARSTAPLLAATLVTALGLIVACTPTPGPRARQQSDQAKAQDPTPRSALDTLLRDMRDAAARNSGSYHSLLRGCSALAWDACANRSAKEVLDSLAAQGATVRERSFDHFSEHRCVVKRSAYVGPTGLSHDLELVFSDSDRGDAAFGIKAVLVARPGRRLEGLLKEQTYPPGTAVDTLFKSPVFASNRPSGSRLVDLIEINYGPFSPISPEGSYVGFSIRLDWSDDIVGKDHQAGNGFFSVTSGLDEPPPWGQLGLWRRPPRADFVPHDTLGEVIYWGGSTSTQTE